MFLAVITSKVRKELNSLGFCGYQDLEFAKSKCGIYFFRCMMEGIFYTVRFYDNGKADLIANDYINLKLEGVSVTEIIAYSKYVIVTQDYEENGEFKFLSLENLKSEIIVKNLATLCRKLCYVEGSSFQNFNNCFGIGTIGVISKKLNVKNNKVLNYVIDNFDNINYKLNKLEKSVIFLGISRGNLFISDDKNTIVIDIVDEVFYGYRYRSVEMFLNMLDDDGKMAFLNEFGLINEEEVLMDKLIDCLFHLYRASMGDVPLAYTNKYLEKINNENLFDVVRNIVDWH